jgi:hypothetical protein
MRYYVISGIDTRVIAKLPTKPAKGEIVVSTAEDLRKSNLSTKRLLAIANAIPGAKKQRKVVPRTVLIDRLWASLEALPRGSSSPEPVRNGSKQAQVIALLRRPGGATINALVEMTGWQPHTIRGLNSGTLKRRLNLGILSEKDGSGARRYRIAAD